MESDLVVALGGELSEYEINLLVRNFIDTPNKFMTTESSKLSGLIKKPLDAIGEIKLQLIKRHIKFQTLYQRNEDIMSISQYGTGIETLDRMLKNILLPLQDNRVWELCGIIGTGKTELLYTLAVNFVCKSKCTQEVLFIDTKNDFSVRRVHDILRERKLNKDDRDNALRAIKVIEVHTELTILAVLEELYKKLRAERTSPNIRLVLVDSLPACRVGFSSDDERWESCCLLTQLASLVRRLATQYHVAFVIGNLCFSQQDENVNPDTYNYGYCDDSQPQTLQQDRLMLGRYWSTVSTLRLALEHPQNTNCSDDDIRLVKVLKNCYGPSGETCLVRITDAGVV
ncbi:DNA repair protein RAD51 homolog 4 [Scaptodrosophila lebanonensis]|uniref:DNA repair protein RAD51 homolog 4 n=1 Tax=Drosophila lebanonensis TaxID=7225 RepID=A0A6J2UHA8_DROLE|nr:DNA repair protein RAD51 homolog 4 [Scaptodrosophila lebanonensis]XP_030387827.1 DNA repair protein RAD51 homolog 4 [Scaptodrosophila lebanonensis]